jgi:plastocyanin
VMAIEKDYSISLSRTAFTPGPYIFVVENQGATPHNLNVRGPGVDGRVSATVDPHSQTELAVTLLKGTYELWCSIDGHKDLGMDITITVR